MSLLVRSANSGDGRRGWPLASEYEQEYELVLFVVRVGKPNAKVEIRTSLIQTKNKS